MACEVVGVENTAGPVNDALSDADFAIKCTQLGGTVYHDIYVWPPELPGTGGTHVTRGCFTVGTDFFGDNCPPGQQCGIQVKEYGGRLRNAATPPRRYLEPCCTNPVTLPPLGPVSPGVAVDPGGDVAEPVAP